MAAAIPMHAHACTCVCGCAPVVRPMLIVSISLLMACIVSYTESAGRRSAPGTLKYLACEHVNGRDR
jgi:hypothetical protein